MDAVLAWFATLDWAAIGQIILIDILLGGDNAVVIALACRNLPPKHRRLGIFWGAAGAIVLRVILISFAVALLNVPALKLIGGVLLIWIGVKLIAPPEDDGHANLQSSDKLWAAIKTIIVADFVMSVDNVIAIAGAAEQADPSHRTGLIIFGLLVSVPFIIFGSQIILKLLDRFPIIVLMGGALLGWIAGGLIVGDKLLVGHVPQDKTVYYAACVAGAVLVVVIAKMVERRRVPADTGANDGA
ncbi:MAG: TerC family protein [Burkholderiales bacterium]|nr:TerC family protein [Burkholderiales bacterium]